MTTEEAFRKWRTDYESDYDKKPSYLEVWQAAISYMQEQSKEVVEAIRERDRLGFAVVNVIGKLDEIIENTQEIEIDDFLHIAVPIDMWNELESSLEDMPNRADLYTTPQSLQNVIDETIERCAKVLDVNVGKYGYEFVKDIRALKGKYD